MMRKILLIELLSEVALMICRLKHSDVLFAGVVLKMNKKEVQDGYGNLP